MVIPDGFTLPPLFYLGLLVLGLVGVVGVLWALGPPITDRTVLALTPWMMLGATFHVLYRVEELPSTVEPFFGAPTVYLTTGVVTGLVWALGCLVVAGGLYQSIDRFLGTVGTVATTFFITLLMFLAWQAGTFSPLWPILSIIITGIVVAITWVLVSVRSIDVTAVTGVTGGVVVFAHALDGISTAIGYDILGVSEEVPASRFILETSASLPTAEYIGAGWLFVLVKISLAVAILWLFTDFVREEPVKARLLLAVMAAVGLGPGTHNVLLFLIAPL